ncbi:hypothetical protein PGTUg99_019438 [Puccinia graminis f. sp. tritici]|uniref:Uncharacterized protein n=1 Tax=Puccinia graminis f. sp. tritici TaxID=56615 RepID=A0A5B0N186_PUCGR|nr:hypothetical protein PGTUg99_019438 [Puccinia graminis f. sp. tritici]
MPADNIGIASKVSEIASEIDAMPILRIGFANGGDAIRGPASLTPMRCRCTHRIRFIVAYRYYSCHHCVVAPGNDETMRYNAINRPVLVSHRFSDTRLSDTDVMHRLSDAMHRYHIGFAMRYRCDAMHVFIARIGRIGHCLGYYLLHKFKLAIGFNSLDKPLMRADTPLNGSNTQAASVRSTYVRSCQKTSLH